MVEEQKGFFLPPRTKKVLVSACLLGVRCRYHGRRDASWKKRVERAALEEGAVLVPVCPESLGGLPTPRPAARRRHGRIWHGDKDVTAQFERGAEKAVAIARAEGCSEAWLLYRSPSCDPQYGLAGKALARAGFVLRGFGWQGHRRQGG